MSEANLARLDIMIFFGAVLGPIILGIIAIQVWEYRLKRKKTRPVRAVAERPPSVRIRGHRAHV
jgi:hypothetical protein